MRKLIRSKRTKAFLKPDGGWTTNISLAMHVPSLLLHDVLRTRLKLDELELYYSFAADCATQWDFALPVA
jgi:hypothetical protein